MQATCISEHNRDAGRDDIHIRVSQSVPGLPGYYPVFLHIDGKAMTQGITTGFFVNPGLFRGPASLLVICLYNSSARMINITEYPLTLSLLGTGHVKMRPRHLAYLTHEPDTRIQTKFRLVFLLTFHGTSHNIVSIGTNQKKCN